MPSVPPPSPWTTPNGTWDHDRRAQVPGEEPSVDLHSPVVYERGDILINKYRLERPLARGGMGHIWQAQHLGLGIDVALKLLRADTQSDHTSERLLREARVLARLAHPCIVRVQDVGVTDYGDPYLTMELLEGEQLGSWLRRRAPVAPHQAVRLMLPVVSAMVGAHQQGVFHRDLKPANLFLSQTKQGRVKPTILDFGIAKCPHELGAEVLTRTGAILGSPDYMSPEQARGRKGVDGRADIWAIAVVLFEMITGTRPFQGANGYAVLMAIVEEDPPSFEEFGVTAPRLEAILRHAMAKAPEHRFQTMLAFGSALASWAVENELQTDCRGELIAHTWRLRPRGSSRRQPAPASSAVRRHQRRPLSTTDFTELDDPEAFSEPPEAAEEHTRRDFSLGAARHPGHGRSSGVVRKAENTGDIDAGGPGLMELADPTFSEG